MRIRYRSDEEMKDSGRGLSGLIYNKWSVCSIKNITQVKDGTHDTPKYVDFNAEGAIPLITSKNCLLLQAKRIINFLNINFIMLKKTTGNISNTIILQKNFLTFTQTVNE